MTFKSITVEVYGTDERGHRHNIIRPVPYRLAANGRESENHAARTAMAQAFEQIPRDIFQEPGPELA